LRQEAGNLPQPSRSEAIRFLLEKGLAKGRGKP
jgi:hypothetical protein